MNDQRVIIVGSGLGGLTSGAVLAHEGYRVTVLERDDCAGGGLRMFARNGCLFETGFHTICGLDSQHTVGRLFRNLGIMDALETVDTDADCFDEVVIGDSRYRLARSRRGFTESLVGYFPDERSNIEAYVDYLWQLTDNMPIFESDIMPSLGTLIMSDGEESIGRCIERFTSNEQLRALLAWNNSLYAGHRYTTPLLTAAIITRLYVESSTRLANGSHQLAKALIDKIRSAGGEIRTGVEVVGFDVRERRVVAALSRCGERIEGDWFIGAIHPQLLVPMFGRGVLNNAYRRRMEGLKNSYSLFTTFVKFKPNSFPYLNYNVFALDDCRNVWNVDCSDSNDYPCGIMLLTPPSGSRERRYAERMIIHTPMPFAAVERWADTISGERGDDYEAFKESCGERLLAMTAKLFDGFEQAVDSVFHATPLTLVDYMHLPEGAIYGTVNDCNNMLGSYVSTRVKLENMLLTGQNVNLHGMCGVPVTAIETCAWITGMEKMRVLISKN